MGLKINGKEMSQEDIKNYTSGSKEDRHYTVFVETEDVCEDNPVTIERAREIVLNNFSKDTCIVDINTGEEVF